MIITRMATPRLRRHTRSLTLRAVFIAAVFSLTALYQYYFSSRTAYDGRVADLDSSWFRQEENRLEEIDAREELQQQGTEGYAEPQAFEKGQKYIGHQYGGGGDYQWPNGRKLLLVVPPHVVPYNDTGDNSTGEPPVHRGNNHTVVCTPPAYHEFPTDAFTAQQRRNGAIILHLIMVIYMFTALAVVCDIYFVASLEKICDKLNLSADVAGATFMAAGSSAPELFTSIIGVFIAKGDVGVGTIVGSAVFNILFVVGICGVLVGQAVPLTWYPLMRDSFFYVISVIILIASIADTQVTWYESTLMLIIYVLYIVVMKFNPVIQAWITPRVHLFTQAVGEDAGKIITGAEKGKFYGGSNTYDGTTVTEMFTNEQEPPHNVGGAGYQSGAPPSTQGNGPRPMLGPGGLGTSKVIPVDDYVMKSTRKVSFEDACFRFMKMRGFRPKTRFRSAVLIIICERRKLLRDPVFMRREQQAMYTYGSVPDSYSNANKENIDLVEDPEPANNWRRIPSTEEGYIARVKWAFFLPINVVLYFTVPDCNLPRWDAWFMVTFAMSIVWIAVFSYIMVWMVVLIGFTMGIPDSIMGITFLAAGTSVPDAMASVMVARQGQGDMAVSNTIGSNVFDVLIGLAFPWWLMTACVSPGTAVHINSNGMVFSVILLFLTVIITIVAIHMGGWKLDKKLGFICLSCYAVFLVFSIMIEFNVFGYVNPPMCAE